MIEIVKGSSVILSCVAYSVWTGIESTSTLADITGATINCYFKNSEYDDDASALFTKSGSVVSGPSGTFTVAIAASDTNSLSQKQIAYEPVVKVGTTYIRPGVDYITLIQNVGKTLF